MEYEFKFKPELVWFVVTAMVVSILQTLVVLDLDKITDVQTWAIGVGAAAVRAGAGAALKYKAKRGVTIATNK